MPNIFRSIIVKRFLAHVLEISTTFAITLILLQVLGFVSNYLLLNGDLTTNLSNVTPNLGNLNSPKDFQQQSFNNIYQLIIGFTIFYFIYAAFNFFFTFSFLYPKNDFSANLFQRIFGFKKYDFGKKKLNHLQKAVKMLIRESVLFISIYGFFAILALTGFQEFFEMFNYMMEGGSTLANILLSLIALFTVFVLPSLILSIITLRKTKDKQLFWDWAASVTLK
jgi:hypothetical protein